MGMKIKGLGKFERNLNNLAKKAQAVSGTHKYAFSEVFTLEFMSKNTKFATIEDFLEASPEHITNNEELEAADEAVLDKFVNQYTSFETWEDMLMQAGKELLIRKMGL